MVEGGGCPYPQPSLIPGPLVLPRGTISPRTNGPLSLAKRQGSPPELPSQHHS